MAKKTRTVKKEENAKQSLQDLINKINGKYGYEAAGMANEAQGLRDIPTVPTGIFQLDVATGGGVRKGSVIEIFGPKQSAKTFIANKILATAQKLCRACLQRLPCECDVCSPHVGAFIDVEGTLNLDWAEAIGLDLSNLVLSRPEHGEQALDTAEDFLKSNGVDIVVLDSVAHITPMREVDGSAEDHHMGKRAILVNSACRKWVAAINSHGLSSRTKPIMVLINHVTQKLDIYGGESRPGGVGQEYASSLDIRVRSGKYHFDDKASGRTSSTGPTDKPWWVELNFSIPKNKFYPPKLSGSFGLWLTDRDGIKAGTTDEFRAIFTAAKSLGLCYKDEDAKVYKLGGIEGRILDDVADQLRADESKFWAIRQLVIDEMLRGADDATKSE